MVINQEKQTDKTINLMNNYQERGLVWIKKISINI